MIDLGSKPEKNQPIATPEVAFSNEGGYKVIYPSMMIHDIKDEAVRDLKIGDTVMAKVKVTGINTRKKDDGECTSLEFDVTHLDPKMNNRDGDKKAKDNNRTSNNKDESDVAKGLDEELSKTRKAGDRRMVDDMDERIKGSDKNK